jgi:hypothetical protein
VRLQTKPVPAAYRLTQATSTAAKDSLLSDMVDMHIAQYKTVTLFLPNGPQLNTRSASNHHDKVQCLPAGRHTDSL